MRADAPNLIHLRTDRTNSQHRREMTAMTVMQRRAWELWIEGYTQEQIGNLFGTGREAISGRLQRARKRLIQRGLVMPERKRLHRRIYAMSFAED
jgi:hypothetical protein